MKKNEVIKIALVEDIVFNFEIRHLIKIVEAWLVWPLGIRVVGIESRCGLCYVVRTLLGWVDPGDPERGSCGSW